MKTKNPRDVILEPVVSEKSYDLIQDLNTYTFIVDRRANKTEIKQAVAEIFDRLPGLAGGRGLVALVRLLLEVELELQPEPFELAPYLFPGLVGHRRLLRCRWSGDLHLKATRRSSTRDAGR